MCKDPLEFPQVAKSVVGVKITSVGSKIITVLVVVQLLESVMVTLYVPPANPMRLS